MYRGLKIVNNLQYFSGFGFRRCTKTFYKQATGRKRARATSYIEHIFFMFGFCLCCTQFMHGLLYTKIAQIGGKQSIYVYVQ